MTNMSKLVDNVCLWWKKLNFHFWNSLFSGIALVWTCCQVRHRNFVVQEWTWSEPRSWSKQIKYRTVQECPPVNHNKKCWPKIWVFHPFLAICVQSDMLENNRIWRLPPRLSQILYVLYYRNPKLTKKLSLIEIHALEITIFGLRSQWTYPDVPMSLGPPGFTRSYPCLHVSFNLSVLCIWASRGTGLKFIPHVSVKSSGKLFQVVPA